MNPRGRNLWMGGLLGGWSLLCSLSPEHCQVPRWAWPVAVGGGQSGGGSAGLPLHSGLSLSLDGQHPRQEGPHGAVSEPELYGTA